MHSAVLDVDASCCGLLLTGFNAAVGKVPKGVEEVKGFKSGSGSTPELATQTTAKPVTIQLTVHAASETVVSLQC